MVLNNCSWCFEILYEVLDTGGCSQSDKVSIANPVVPMRTSWWGYTLLTATRHHQPGSVGLSWYQVWFLDLE